jgi:hypothetical protein
MSLSNLTSDNKKAWLNAKVNTLEIDSGAVISGTYTPVASNLTNLDSVTNITGKYQQIGGIVIVNIFAEVDSIATSVTTSFEVDLPVPRTGNFTTDREGTGNGAVGKPSVPSLPFGALCESVPATQNMLVSWNPIVATAIDLSVTITYTI